MSHAEVRAGDVDWLSNFTASCIFMGCEGPGLRRLGPSKDAAAECGHSSAVKLPTEHRQQETWQPSSHSIHSSLKTEWSPPPGLHVGIAHSHIPVYVNEYYKLMCTASLCSCSTFYSWLMIGVHTIKLQYKTNHNATWKPSADTKLAAGGLRLTQDLMLMF